MSAMAGIIARNRFGRHHATKQLSPPKQQLWWGVGRRWVERVVRVHQSGWLLGQSEQRHRTEGLYHDPQHDNHHQKGTEHLEQHGRHQVSTRSIFCPLLRGRQLLIRRFTSGWRTGGGGRRSSRGEEWRSTRASRRLTPRARRGVGRALRTRRSGLRRGRGGLWRRWRDLRRRPKRRRRGRTQLRRHRVTATSLLLRRVVDAHDATPPPFFPQ
jgi:hypothetical protein